MPISIKEFKEKKNYSKLQENVDNVENLLRENQDKAYSILDLQTHFKLPYHLIKKVIMTLKRRKVLEWNWYRVEGRRMLFYHWIGKKKWVDLNDR